jgi:hypothetical protein
VFSTASVVTAAVAAGATRRTTTAAQKIQRIRPLIASAYDNVTKVIRPPVDRQQHRTGGGV